jgi:hypothetical protein
MVIRKQNAITLHVAIMLFAENKPALELRMYKISFLLFRAPANSDEKDQIPH